MPGRKQRWNKKACEFESILPHTHTHTCKLAEHLLRQARILDLERTPQRADACAKEADELLDESCKHKRIDKGQDIGAGRNLRADCASEEVKRTCAGRSKVTVPHCRKGWLG